MSLAIGNVFLRILKPIKLFGRKLKGFTNRETIITTNPAGIDIYWQKILNLAVGPFDVKCQRNRCDIKIAILQKKI